jgi:MFS family permease
MAAVAIPWFVLVSTGSVARTGVAAFFTTLPLALGALFGGAVADRIGTRTTSVASDLLSGLAIAGIPLLHAVGELDFGRLVVLAFLGSLFDAPGQAAREALLPDAAGRAGVSLERATALWTTTEHAGYVLGAPVAGVLIAAVGAPNVLWLDAASFGASALLVATTVRRAASGWRRRDYLAELLDGLRFVAREPALRRFLTISTVGNFLIAPLTPVVLAVYARQELGGPTDFGILVGTYGAGGIAGAAAFALLGARVPRRPLFVLVWAAYPLLSFALVPVPGLATAAAILFGIGLLAGAYGPLDQLVRQERTPAELRGRVFATFMASLTVVVAPAVLAAGFLLEAAGLRATILAFAAGNTALALYAVAGRARADVTPAPRPEPRGASAPRGGSR